MGLVFCLSVLLWDLLQILRPTKSYFFILLSLFVLIFSMYAQTDLPGQGQSKSDPLCLCCLLGLSPDSSLIFFLLLSQFPERICFFSLFVPSVGFLVSVSALGLSFPFFFLFLPFCMTSESWCKLIFGFFYPHFF